MATKAERFRASLERSGTPRPSRAVAATTGFAMPTFGRRAMGTKAHQKAGIGQKAKQLLALLAPRSRAQSSPHVPSAQRRS